MSEETQNQNTEETQNQDGESQEKGNNPDVQSNDSSVVPEVEEKSLRELQDEAIELGMAQEEAEAFRTKAPLQIMINHIKDSHEKLKEAKRKARTAPVETSEDKPVEKVKSIEERPNPREDKIVARRHREKANRMREVLEKQPKVRILLPLEGKEKRGVVREVMVRGRKEQVYVSGSVETVQLNGYKILIPKGVYMDVPQQVADVLNESMKITQNAGAEFLADRLDPATGRQVSDNL